MSSTFQRLAGRVWRSDAVQLLLTVACSLALFVAVLAGCGYGCYRYFVPSGEDIGGMLGYRYASTSAISQGPGVASVRVVLNDVGAAHSGAHFVWIFDAAKPEGSWPLLTSGFTNEIDPGEVVTWLDENTIEVWLTPTKRGSAGERRVIRVGTH